MSTRSHQADSLGHELAQQSGLLHVDIQWSGPRKHGGYGGWRVEWIDGPTVLRMRALVMECAARFPAIPVASLRYDRCRSNLAETVALLLYIDRDPRLAALVDCPLVLSGYDTIDSPERADEVWQNRARAFLRFARRPITSATALNILGERTRGGWDSALAWLDQLVTQYAAEAQSVVDLVKWRSEHGWLP